MIFKEKNLIDKEIGVHYQFINSLNVTSTLHSHDFYEVFIVLSDFIIHYLNGNKYELYKNTLVFIKPQDSHYFTTCENGSFLNIAFSIKTFDLINSLLNINDYSPIVIPQCVTGDIVNDINSISSSISDNAEISINLKKVVVNILSLFGTRSKKSDYPQWFNELLDNINQPSNFTRGLDSMYELSGKSPEHTTRSFRKYLNTTPTEYLNSLKLNYAKNMLITSDTSVTDICFSSGFNNTSYFYVQFKKKYNCSPKEYRLKYRTATV